MNNIEDSKTRSGVKCGVKSRVKPGRIVEYCRYSRAAVSAVSPEELSEELSKGTPACDPASKGCLALPATPNVRLAYLESTRHLLAGRLNNACTWVVMSEVSTQHALHNSCWFFEYCNRELTLGENALILAGTKDEEGCVDIIMSTVLLCFFLFCRLFVRVSRLF